MEHTREISTITDEEISKTLLERLAWLLKTDYYLGNNNKDSYVKL